MLQQNYELMDEKIDYLRKFSETMDASIQDLENIDQIYDDKTADYEKTYEWNKANVDLQDWQKFKKSNKTLITNIEKISKYNDKIKTK